jgi:hypothetical protein
MRFITFCVLATPQITNGLFDISDHSVKETQRERASASGYYNPGATTIPRIIAAAKIAATPWGFGTQNRDCGNRLRIVMQSQGNITELSVVARYIYTGGASGPCRVRSFSPKFSVCSTYDITVSDPGCCRQWNSVASSSPSRSNLDFLFATYKGIFTGAIPNGCLSSS